MNDISKNEAEKLLAIVRDVVEHDNTLRQEFNIGDKFSFVRERLRNLLNQLEDEVKTHQETIEAAVTTRNEDETELYIYIYNSQGLALDTWHKMLHPSVFYEYSVNRPIYLNKADVEALIRTKADRAQHGYISIAVKNQHISPVPTDDALKKKDAIGGILIRVREGSLDAKRVLSFSHNGHEYQLDASGKLVKKS